MQQQGLLPEEQIGVAPDIYTKNAQMAHELKNLRREMNKYKEATLWVGIVGKLKSLGNQA